MADLVFKAKKFRELSTLEFYKIVEERVAIFVVEQHCPYQEVDEYDPLSIHLWFEEDTELVAYCRLIPKGIKNDKVVMSRVIAKKRGYGLGKKIVLKAIETEAELFNNQEIFIEAQSYAQGFYEKCGFKKCGEEFLEDNIPHIPMLYKNS